MSLVIPPNGHAAFFEIKTPHDVLRTRQDEVISALLDSGASTCIPRCLDDAIAALVDWLEPGTKPYDKLHRLTFHNGTASQIADSSALQPAGGVETGKRHHGKTRKD